MALNYLDFDLSIEPIDLAAGRYRARVLASPVGEASTEFVLPFSTFEVENYILKMGRPRQGVRGLNSSEGRAAQEFGRKLYDAIFQGEVRDCLRSSLSEVNQQTDQGLRLRLRLGGAPALADLPWEYLYDTSFRRFFAHSAATPIVRYLDLPERIQPLAVQPPLKILVMIASPRDYGQLDVEDEWRKLQDALGNLAQRGLVTLRRLEKATLTGLQRQLRREQYHIFHFIGHGGFDQQTQEGVLLLEDESGLARRVSGSYIGALLHDHRSLRLAVLNACEGALAAQTDPFAGVAQTLMQQGIPAVIAMQFEITDRAAITFAHEFYSALADRYPVDAALAEARKAIFAEGNDVEWGTPVLYLRAQDGGIFEVYRDQVLEQAALLTPQKHQPYFTQPEARSLPKGCFMNLGIMQLTITLSMALIVISFLVSLSGIPRVFTTTGGMGSTPTAKSLTPTPNFTATADANATVEMAVAVTKTVLASMATLTPTATAILSSTVTATLTSTMVVSPAATATITSMPTITFTPAVTVTLMNPSAPSSTVPSNTVTIGIKPVDIKSTLTSTLTPISTRTPVSLLSSSSSWFVNLESPADGLTVNGKILFTWSANFSLPPGYAFELVFWKKGQDPLHDGLGWGGSSLVSQTKIDFTGLPEGDYYWGVRLIKQSPFAAIRMLSDNRGISVRSPSSTSHSSGTPQPGPTRGP